MNETTAAQTAGGKPRKLTWKGKLLLIFIGVLLAHVLLEVCLRAVGFVFHYEAQHHSSSHPASAYVILCVGDSCTYGYGSSDPETKSYPAQLQKLIRQRAPQQELYVERMGLPGANSSQLARRLEGFVKLHNPDMLILLAGNNAIWNLKDSNAALFADNSEWEGRLKLRVGAFLDSIYTYRFYKRFWTVFGDGRKEEFKPMKGVLPTEKYFDRGSKFFGDIANVQKLYEHDFKQMLDLARKRGIETMVLDYHSPSYLFETEYLQPALKKLGCDMVDLQPPFDEATSKGLDVMLPDGGWHPNDLGYALYARIVFNELVRRGIVKAPPIEDVLDATLAPL